QARTSAVSERSTEGTKAQIKTHSFPCEVRWNGPCCGHGSFTKRFSTLGSRFKCVRIRCVQFFRSLRRPRHRQPGREPLSTVSRKLIDAHESERTWLARELHDDITHRLSLILVGLGNLHEGDPSLVELRQGIGHAMQQVLDLNTDIQRLSHRLHSSKLDLLGL